MGAARWLLRTNNILPPTRTPRAPTRRLSMPTARTPHTCSSIALRVGRHPRHRFLAGHPGSHRTPPSLTTPDLPSRKRRGRGTATTTVTTSRHPPPRQLPCDLRTDHSQRERARTERTGYWRLLAVSNGLREGELAVHEVDHGGEVLCGSVSAGPGLGGLHERGEAWGGA